MRWSRRSIAEAVGGTAHGPDADVFGVSIDTRSGVGGALFVPLVAERDGHEFIAAARAAGAAAWLTQRSDAEMLGDGAIVVPDTAAALAALGRAARRRLPDRVIGITGSAGKTSTKDLTAAILRAHGPAAASERSFNNEFGVPLTLANAPEDAWAAVIEMGARGVGHIATLCAVARPTVGVVTNIGTAHRELFGSAHMTAIAKSEIVQSLPGSGTAVLNADDEMLPVLRERASAPVLTFSAEGRKTADVRATGVRLDDELRAAFRLESPFGGADISLRARGRHQVANALAAASASLAVGASMDEVVLGLATDELSAWRMELRTTATGVRVLNDSYNANPGSMVAALDALAALPARRRIAVLGTMAELGAEKREMHEQVAAKVRALGIDLALSLAEPDYGLEVVGSVDEAVERLGLLAAGDVVLVKGSRVAGLEVLAERLLASGDGAAS